MLSVMVLSRVCSAAASFRSAFATLLSTAIAITLAAAPLTADDPVDSRGNEPSAPNGVTAQNPDGERQGLPVSAVDAAIDGKRVRVVVSVEGPPKDLIAFRSIDPITSSAALAEALEVARLGPGQGFFFDDPPPGVPTYYAVLTAEMLNYGEPQFVENVNITATPVRLPADQPFAAAGDPEDALRTARTRPLPVLNPELSAITGEPLPPRALPDPSRVPISGETRAAIERLRSAAPEEAYVRPEPHVLDSERRPPERKAGVDHTLQQIIETAFERERWLETSEYLEGLRTLPLTAEQESRVYFYLGQAHFYLDHFRRATTFMLQASGQLYVESRVWIEAALDRLAER